MAIIAYALPIVPGQEDSARNFGGELDDAGLRDRYEALNRAAGLRGHHEWFEELRSGNLLVVAFELDEPQKLMRSFTEGDPYDTWWRARVERIHGFDPEGGGVLPVPTYGWAPESSD